MNDVNAILHERIDNLATDFRAEMREFEARNKDYLDATMKGQMENNHVMFNNHKSS